MSNIGHLQALKREMKRLQARVPARPGNFLQSEEFRGILRIAEQVLPRFPGAMEAFRSGVAQFARRQYDFSQEIDDALPSERFQEARIAFAHALAEEGM